MSASCVRESIRVTLDPNPASLSQAIRDGKTSFEDRALVENYSAAIDEVLRLKPSASKGRYIEKATMATTMGPGIPLDYTKTRNLLSEDEA